jgi:hypothetical protein
MIMSDLIKNPQRNRPRPVEARQSEYEKLGITPTPGSISYGGGLKMAQIAKLPATNEVEDDVDMNGSFGEEDIFEQSAGRLSHQPMIDNNEAMNFNYEEDLSKAIDSGEVIDLDNSSERSSMPRIGEYILMVSGRIILSGALDLVESKVQTILYGEDEEFKEVPQEDIVVLKRVALQVGVFIKE